MKIIYVHHRLGLLDWDLKPLSREALLALQALVETQLKIDGSLTKIRTMLEEGARV